MKLFSKKRIELGKGHIVQYTLFEHKTFGGIWIYNWKSIEQNRFHTHAFGSYAFLLGGEYTEEVIEDGKIVKKTVNQWMKPRHLPRNYTHRILEAKTNTWTMVFFGKWLPYWWEYFNDTHTWVKYGWGREVLYKILGDETTDIINVDRVIDNMKDAKTLEGDDLKLMNEYTDRIIDTKLKRK